MRRGLGFWTGLGFTLLISAFLILPVLASVVAGVTANQFIGLSSGLTTRWVLEVWANYGGTVLLSLQIALATLAASLLLGIPAAYVLARHAGVTARLVEEALVMPVAVPGLATALGLILAYGAAGDLRSSWLFILVGHIVFCLPFMVRAVLAVLLALDLKALEDAARACGASGSTVLAAAASAPIAVAMPTALSARLSRSMPARCASRMMAASRATPVCVPCSRSRARR